MSGVSLPVTRPSGRALLVCNPASRPPVFDALGRLGYGCGEADDPYAAMAELCRRPLVYRAVILSLASLYREELVIIRTLKRRYPQVEVWLAHTDGRQSALAEAMRLGADGLLDDDGFHRVVLAAPASEAAPAVYAEHDAIGSPEPLLGPSRLTAEDAGPSASESGAGEPDDTSGEPILSAEELRALLLEQPSMPPAGDEEG